MTLDRRTLIHSAAGAAVLTAAAPRFSFAATPGDRRFIVIVMRGALDGLAAVPPHGDPDYTRARGSLALPKDAILNLDGSYGLNAKLPTFKALYDQKQLAIIHAVASPYRERSHFDGQNVIETGAGRPMPTGDGWLNRALGPAGVTDPRLALAVAQSIPVILQGQRPVTSWMPPQLPSVDDDFLMRLKAMYARDPVLRSALDRALEVGNVAGPAGGDMRTNAQQMRGARGYRFEPLAKMAANIIAAQDGPRIAVMEVGGWDTHQGQGTTQGVLAFLLDNLDKGVKAIKDTLGPTWDRTTILFFTEFGRTVAPNGSNGTDHGTASVAFVAGGAVNGGRVLGNWPGLKPGALYEGRDLAPTTDLRAVFKGVLADHMRLSHAQVDGVFPDSGAIAPLQGLIRT
jgi:uncharacterized protein (DUF1501 family)